MTAPREVTAARRRPWPDPRYGQGTLAGHEYVERWRRRRQARELAEVEAALAHRTDKENDR
mgnify:CR=1 FL=1